MSGICGIVLNARDRGIGENDLFQMVKGFNPREDRGSAISTGSVGIGVKKFGYCFAGAEGISVNGFSLIAGFYGVIIHRGDLPQGPTRDSSDIQFLVKSYLQHGLGMLKNLRGEFVFAIWDGREETLFLVTDRFRIHQMFYYQDRDKFVFSSHLNGLLSCPLPVERTVNAESVVNVVGSSIIPSPNSIYKEIKKVPPGHVLMLKNNEIKLKSYWEISFNQPSEEEEKVLALKLRSQFKESLSSYLDVDTNIGSIGTFLSGGVDSSTITGLLTNLTGRPVKTFTIGFDEDRYNEIDYARVASEAFHTEHHEYFVTPEDTLKAIPLLADIFDEPFANASAIPAYYCAKMARENGVGILYAGDGGDELFAGNERYATQRLFDYYHDIPYRVRETFLKPIVYTLADMIKMQFFVKAKKYVDRSRIPYQQRINFYDFFNVVPTAEFLEDGFLEMVGRDFDPYHAYHENYCRAPASTNLDRHLYLDWHLTLSDNDLIKVTRSAEAALMTVRFPFLDKQLVEFSVTVPARMKMRGMELRSFFKNAYADLLPKEIRRKKKHGFGLPIPIWLKTYKPLNELMHELVLGQQTVQRGYFKRKALETLIENHKKDTTSFYGTVLWNIMTLELWHRKVCDELKGI